jgi:hypothetical protein
MFRAFLVHLQEFVCCFGSCWLDECVLVWCGVWWLVQSSRSLHGTVSRSLHGTVSRSLHGTVSRSLHGTVSRSLHGTVSRSLHGTVRDSAIGLTTGLHTTQTHIHLSSQQLPMQQTNSWRWARNARNMYSCKNKVKNLLKETSSWLLHIPNSMCTQTVVSYQKKKNWIQIKFGPGTYWSYCSPGNRVVKTVGANCHKPCM